VADRRAMRKPSLLGNVLLAALLGLAVGGALGYAFGWVGVAAVGPLGVVIGYTIPAVRRARWRRRSGTATS
jgi:hypothetical protein